jgi:hypothetical protein
MRSVGIMPRTRQDGLLPPKPKGLLLPAPVLSSSRLVYIRALASLTARLASGA